MSLPTSTGTVPQGEGETVPAKPHIDLPRDAAAWLDAYRVARAQEAYWADTAKRARQHLEQMLGDAETGRLDGTDVVRWTYVYTNRLDQNKLKEQAPDLVRECTIAQVTRRFTITDPA